ncbi:MAG: DegT/DnrJ/EryC1/StrS family aminotransferase [Victivallales bacterium]|nr:DegT/DnrJ/EryC1/StrS family aminotransferase [Victivallales bacterium]
MEEKEAVNRLLDKAIETGNAPGYNGPEEDAYCAEFAEYMGGGFADGVNSGTTAVFVALKALDLKPFSEVIVGSVTDPGGIMPIVMNNCIPIVADTMPNSYNTNVAKIKELITPLTSAIVVAHIGGDPADIENITALAKERGLKLVEDCAQCHGAELNGEKLGTFGDVSAFSTMFGKHHCSGGQGGLVFTKNEELYWSVRRNADRGKPFGLPQGSSNCIASLNFNMDEIAAAIGKAQLRKLPGIIEARRTVAAKLAPELRKCRSISIPESIPGANHSYWWWRLTVNTYAISCDKDTFCAALAEEGLPINPKYTGALPYKFAWFENKKAFGNTDHPWSSPEYTGNGNSEFKCPNAETAMETNFNLSINEAWTDKEIADAVAIIKKVEAKYAV